MNNTTSTTIQNIVNKLPVPIFFEQLPDRKQALKYIEWLNNNSPESKNFNQDQLFREVISKELRIVSMKITEIEILLMVGLNTITLNDFTIDSKSLVAKLISENTDNYDLDIMYRIMAQIMSKLPKDLKERVTGKQKLEIFQKIAQSINIDNKLLEKFISFDPSLNTPISMDIDAGDYNSLNKKYLDELQRYEEAKGYVDSNSIDFAEIASRPIKPPPKLNTTVKAKYIDNQPDLMLGQNDNTLYYFDNSSGTLTEIPTHSKQKPVSIQDLKTILSSEKVKKNEIQNLIDSLQSQSQIQNQTPIITEQSNYFDKFSSYFSWSSHNQATITTSATPTPSLTVPVPPKYILNIVNPKQNSNTYSSQNKQSSQNDNLSDIEDKYNFNYSNYNLEKRFQDRKSTYYGSESFQNNNNNNNNNIKKNTDISPSEQDSEPFSNMNEHIFLKKLKNENKQIENVALSFIAIIILVFLLVIFNSIRNKK